MSKDTNTPQATVKIALDPRVKKDDLNKEILVCLKVFYQGKWRAYGIDQYLTPNEFELYSIDSKKTSIREFKKIAQKNLEKANNIIENLGDDFTFARFKEALKGNLAKNKANNLYDYFEQVVKQKQLVKTTTTADTYKYTLKSLKSFRKANPEFKEIDTIFLNKYKAWFLNGERSETTLGIYLRTLRAVLNMAIDDGLMKREQYPFGAGKRKFKIPVSRNIKKALSLADIKQIAEYTPANDAEAYNRDIWLFSYLCNGMNLKDIALLRFKNIRENGIVFTRAKTKDSAPKQIFVPLLPQSRAIIERWSNPTKKPENLIFDLIPDTVSPERFIARKKQRVKTLNKYMRDIFEKLELGEYQGLMSARHSFATVMKRSGASIESISEALGHSNIKTTENYLDSFESDEKMKLQQNLVNF